MHISLILIIAFNLFPISVAEYGKISGKSNITTKFIVGVYFIIIKNHLSVCKQYGQAVYVTETDLGMASRSGFNNVSECGIVSVPLIIGGEEANEKEFPHFVSTLYYMRFLHW